MKHPHSVRALLTGAAQLFFFAGVAQASPVFPGAGSVGLEPPPGMSQAKDYMGFQKAPASIVITDLPAEAYSQINADRSDFGSKIAGAKVEDFSVGSNAGFIVRGHETVRGAAYRKWVVVVGTPRETALVTAQVPDNDKDISDAAIETALKTITFRDRPGLPEQIAALPFSVGDLAGFRPVKTLAGSGMILTQGDKDVDPAEAQPHIVIATSLAPPPPAATRLDYAKQVLQSLGAVQAKTLGDTKLVDSGGATWAEIQATGTEGKDSAPVDISFFIRFSDTNSILVVCAAPKADKPVFDARFRQLALSVTPKG